jgi:hypothetical protein
LNQTDSAYTKTSAERLQQGDILRSVPYFYPRFEGLGASQLDVTLPYIVILTQDCDLQWDFCKREIQKEELQDHFLHAILVCPAYNAQKFREGTHLDHWRVKMGKPDHYHNIKSNNHKRYHHLDEDRNYTVPELILDFKHYYAIHVDVLYKMKTSRRYVATIEKLFREDLSHRFSFYLSRIGLPDLKLVDKSELAQCINAG